jgi:SAM-dependent methyltransferase
MPVELEFNRYARHGAYHWARVSSHPLRRNAFVVARYQRCIALAVESLGSLKGRRVLDLGCGDGVLAWLLWKRGAKVVGVDPTAEAIEYAQHQHRARQTDAQFSTMSEYDSGQPDQSFDAVISTDVIEHVQQPELLLREAQRVLKPGGVGIVTTPIRLAEHPPAHVQHVQEWFPDEFCELVRGVFPDTELFESHPLVWMEINARSRAHRIALNLLSFVWNPFTGSGWRYRAQQYARVTKRHPPPIAAPTCSPADASTRTSSDNSPPSKTEGTVPFPWEAAGRGSSSCSVLATGRSAAPASHGSSSGLGESPPQG